MAKTNCTKACIYCKENKSLDLFKNSKIKSCIECNSKYPCDGYEGCNKAFCSASDLRRHIKSAHLKIKDNKCNYEGCNKSFSASEKLRRHIKGVHLKIKDKVCTYEECEKSFSTAADLRKHIKGVHLKIKDKVCTYEDCKKSFSSTSNLLSHIKGVHLKIKDHECTKGCKKSFSSSAKLRQHQKTCTGKENISAGEFKVNQILREMMVEFTHDRTLVALTTFSGKNLRPDFYITKKGYKPIIIEYNGIQHYEPKAFGSGGEEQAKENFEKTQESDQLKRDFCKQEGIHLLEISYKDYPRVHQIVSQFLIDKHDWCDEDYYR